MTIDEDALPVEDKPEGRDDDNWWLDARRPRGINAELEYIHGCDFAEQKVRY